MSDYYAVSNERLQRKLDGIMRRIDGYRTSNKPIHRERVNAYNTLLCQRDRVRAQMCNLAGRV